MAGNPITARWALGDPTLNGWLSIPSGVSAEIMAWQGFDTITIDMQHGLIGYQAALSMLQAISGTKSVPLVRTPWLEPSVTMKMLDAGAMGIICPLVNTAADAHALVRSCTYPPVGYRSVGPTRVSLYHDNYVRAAKDLVLVIAQVETEEAVENIDEIVGTQGLDAVYVGPADLGLSLGCEPVLDSKEPLVLDAISKVAASAKRHGVVAGIHCGSVGYALEMVDRGYQMVTVQSDVRLLSSSASAIVREFQNSTAKAI